MEALVKVSRSSCLIRQVAPGDPGRIHYPLSGESLSLSLGILAENYSMSSTLRGQERLGAYGVLKQHVCPTAVVAGCADKEKTTHVCGLVNSAGQRGCGCDWYALDVRFASRYTV